ncbi:MogA/MoaB family molybdenum cofactor biosynthesis protein [Rudaeicoccus suwonensis]|uniref:Molybdenum cofactor synthesis domain-containing protein n=1 Tax=Rudaeicoccus suwonensis TaxID=657409 RepID=A0A561E865_9MICO|nr:MogA/MoaB family molybdenum cofactor biosynthesis protein [Rudaeicoccus suwonensis]TWE11750.1 molybdenum cofactor synthesis domain-containing protein [Rudaeicoccus suwonensis]
MPEAVVVTCSDRAAAGTYDDRSGPVLEAALTSWGFVVRRVVVPDGPPVGEALRAAIASGADVVLTTGGTGVSATDVTPEQTMPLIDCEIPGIAEALRAAGVAKGVPTAVLSRGVAGLSGRCLIVNLPGSSGAVRDALAVLEPVVAHVVSQVSGGDHPRTDHEGSGHTDAGHSGPDHPGADR